MSKEVIIALKGLGVARYKAKVVLRQTVSLLLDSSCLAVYLGSIKSA